MDRQKEERERGVTISCTTKEFFTAQYHYTIIDAPGARGSREEARAQGWRGQADQGSVREEEEGRQGGGGARGVGSGRGGRAGWLAAPRPLGCAPGAGRRHHPTLLRIPPSILSFFLSSFLSSMWPAPARKRFGRTAIFCSLLRLARDAPAPPFLPPSLPSRLCRPQGLHQEHDLRRRPGRRVPAHGPC